MKILPVIFLLIAAVLLSGCTSAPPDAAGTPPENQVLPLPPVPDLVGNWTGSMTGYTEGLGYLDFPGETMILSVTEQRGRIFSGQLYFLSGGAVNRMKGFAGVIGSDGRTFTMAEKSGYTHGKILSRNEIEIVYTDDSTPFSVALDSLKRV